MQSADLSRKFQEVLARYLEAREKGTPVDPQALLRAHPELAAELKEFFANERQLASAAGMEVASEKNSRGAAARSRSSTIGDYELLGEIARGGMGVVHRARHISLQRLVALKMLLGGEFAGPDGLRRFRTEAEVVAGLDHPHIVPIYDLGEHNGQAFFCMKLIDGPSLKEQVPWFVGKPEAAARMIVEIAHAVHHAHQRGILHRDLKPGNILLEAIGQPRGGRKKKNALPFYPYVTDFGLAKRFQSGGKASQSTVIVGTAAYMAPEQATGRQALSVAADVYSLGAILYQLLTGRPPFVGENYLEILLQVVEQEAPSPLTLQPGLDSDLAQICLKCLRKNPEDRYASAEVLAVDLEQWLEGEPLSVRAPTRRELLWRTCRRHPFAVLSSSFIVLLLLTIAGLSAGGNWYLNDLNEQLHGSNEKLLAAKEQAVEKEELAQANERRAREEADKALEAARRERLARLDAEKAETARKLILEKEIAARKAEADALRESRRLLVQHYLANGQQLLQRGDLYGAAIWFGEALQQDQDHPQRAAMHRIRLGTTLRQCPPLAQLWLLDDKVRMLRLSPSGDRLLTVTREKSAALWDTKTGRAVGGPLTHDGTLTAAEFSSDGLRLYTAGADDTCRLWSAATGLPHGSPLKHDKTLHAAVFSQDSKAIATAAGTTVRIWDVATTKATGKTLVHDQEVRSVAFHPDGKRVLTVSENLKFKKGDKKGDLKGELQVWDIVKNTRFSLPRPAKSGVRTAGFSRDGRRVFEIAAGQLVRMWETATGKAIALPDLHVKADKGDHGHWFSPALDKVVQAADTEVKILDLPGGAVAHSWRHDSPVTLAQFSPAGKFVLSAAGNRGVQLWRSDTGSPYSPVLPGDGVTTARFSGNDQWLAVASDRSVRLWNLAWSDRDKSQSLPKKNTLLSVSPDGKKALLAQATGVHFWDAEQARPVGLAMGTATMALQARWSSDGRSMATASRDEVRVWEFPAGKPLTPSLKCEEAPGELQFSPDGKELAAWSKGQLRVWEIPTGQALLTRKLPKGVLLFDYAGRQLAVGKKNTLEIQDWTNDRARLLLKVTSQPELFRFSPDLQSGAAAFADGSLRILDLSDGKPITPVFWHGEPIRRLVYSADGRFLASAGNSGRVRIWDAATGQPLSPALFVGGTLVGMSFRGDGEVLRAWTEGRLHRWSLRPAQGDAAEILEQTRIAASQEPHASSGSLIPLEASRLHERWLKSRISR